MQLNLTRRWRSKKFDELVGQDLVVKLIKNSLYRNFLFPVYLLSGTRGCGKTSTGRLFAAALNCSELAGFQTNPKKVDLPCLICSSCKSMQSGNHPDFIEIDAASHTGVDNIRNIIDSASFSPVFGSKKIFLIDEAHMLSKAAFNALLKVLEEPPKATLFMLATTDPHKILDTVRSRCFQLFFQRVEPDIIADHLSKICISENIKFDKDALGQIALSSEGSVRDAINLLERIRLVTNNITKNQVVEILGFIDESKLIKILIACLNQDDIELLKLLSKFKLENLDSQFIWKKFVELLRELLWSNQFSCKDSIKSSLFDKEILQRLSNEISVNLIISLLDICYKYENYLYKTSVPHIVLETMFLSLCSLKKNFNNSLISFESNNQASSSAINKNINKNDTIYNAEREVKDNSWVKFLNEILELKDSPLVSIFKQSKYNNFDKANGIIEIELPARLEFLQDLLYSNMQVWKPILIKNYKDEVDLKVIFNNDYKEQVVNKVMPKLGSNNIVLESHKQKIKKLEKSNAELSKEDISNNGDINFSTDTVDINVKEKWPKANLLLQYFPGVVTQVKDF